MKRPILSIVVVFHDMIREAERTLFSLSTRYQTEVSDADCEIIAIDNGSTRPLDPDGIAKIAPNISYRFLKTESVSPAAAVNSGVNASRGEFVAVIVDGARMASPGLLGTAIKALHIHPNPFVSALSWHLGPDVQNVSMLNGYDQSVEDQLLDSIGWRDDGYRLFEISTIAQSSGIGLLGGLPTECSFFAMRKSQFDDIGGFDQRFQCAGGGLINQDFLKRVLAIPTIDPVVMLGEGVFHQYHGGVATNVPMASHPFSEFNEEYTHIHGQQFVQDPPVEPSYFGRMHPAAMRFVNRSGAE